MTASIPTADPKSTPSATDGSPRVPHESLGRLFLRFLKFGSLAWGGPVAQIAMIRQELVAEEKWVTSEHFNRVLAHGGIPHSNATDAALAALQEYHRTENLWEEICDGVMETLPALRALGVTMVVVSNANGRLMHAFRRLDLARWFDHLLDSHDWGVETPDPRLFAHALEMAGASAERTIHVGDLYHVDVAGARAAGLRDAVLLDPHDLYPTAECTRIRRLQEIVPFMQGR